MNLKCLFLIGLSLIAGTSNMLAQGKPNILWQRNVNSDRINAIIFNNAGDTVISGSSDRLINFWRASDGVLQRTLNNAAAPVHESAIESLSITRDGTRLASATHRLVQLWTLPAGTVQNLEGHTDWVVGVAFSPNGQFLASASFDSTVKIWRASDGVLVRTFTHPNMMRCVAFSPDSTLLAVGGGNGALSLWRTADWTRVRNLAGHTSDIYSMTFSPDGTRLATGAYDNTARVWNPSNGALQHTFRGNGTVYGVAFTPNSQELAFTDGEGNTIRMHRLSDGVRTRLFDLETPEVQCIAISRSGMMAYGRVDHRVLLANLGTTTTPPPTTPPPEPEPEPVPPPTTANWTLTLSREGNGTVTASPGPNGPNGTYANGTVVRVTATAREESVFFGWQGSSVSKNPSLSITMNGNKRLVAVFGEAKQPAAVLMNVERQLIAWFLDGRTLDDQLMIRNGTRLNPELRFVGLGDINKDGNKDFVFQDKQYRLLVWYMNGADYVGQGWIRNAIPVPSAWTPIGVEDMNHDGRPDIILRHTDGRTQAWLFQGTRFVTAQALKEGTRMASGWVLVATADMDGDGNKDIVWQNQTTRAVVIWLMDGTSVKSTHIVQSKDSLGRNWKIVAAHDFNENGKPDLVWQDSTDGRILVWLMDVHRHVGGVLVRNSSGTKLKLLGIK